MVYRQVHPSLLQHGRVTSRAFHPTPRDKGVLSGYDGDQMTPHQSWVHYTEVVKLVSCGVLGLTVSEWQSRALTVTLDGVPYPEHVSIDFNVISQGTWEKTSKLLRDRGVSRGWLYQPT